MAGAAAAGFIGPDDLVHEILCAKNFIQKKTKLVAHAVIDVEVKRAIPCEQPLACGEHCAHHGKVFLLAERVRIGRDCKARFPGGKLYGKRIARSKGRIKIDELDLLFIFAGQPLGDLLRPAQQKQSGATCRIHFPFAMDGLFHARSLPLWYKKTRCKNRGNADQSLSERPSCTLMIWASMRIFASSGR